MKTLMSDAGERSHVTRLQANECQERACVGTNCLYVGVYEVGVCMDGVMIE
jgi:hypothetical protein